MKKKILIVSSSFYKNLEKKLLSGAFNEINKKLFSVNHFSVSGAYEIPQYLKNFCSAILQSTSANQCDGAKREANR